MRPSAAMSMVAAESLDGLDEGVAEDPEEACVRWIAEINRRAHCVEDEGASVDGVPIGEGGAVERAGRPRCCVMAVGDPSGEPLDKPTLKRRG